MNGKQLTTDQIQILHNLVQRNAITYYDVEVEIVDHYASAIEAIWEREPELSFYQAQLRVYEEFWDFRKLEQEKRKQVTIRAHKDAWKAIKGMFGWPKVLELLGIFSICWFALSTLRNLGWDTGIFLDIWLFPIIGLSIPQGTTLLKFKKKMNNYEFLSLYRITSTGCIFITLFYISHFLLMLSSPIPSAFLLAIFLISMKDMYAIVKEEMNLLEQRFPAIKTA